MDPEAIRSFARRDWQAVERSKREHGASVRREQGSAPAVEAWWTLWQHLRATQPTWPDASQRAEDVAHHADVARKLALARHVASVISSHA